MITYSETITKQNLKIRNTHLIISETNLFPELSFRISLRPLLAALAKGSLAEGCLDGSVRADPSWVTFVPVSL